ncbi:Peptidase M23B [Mesorhizobium loti]|nr:Peptidase M23B [Mesorhizobium loti]
MPDNDRPTPPDERLIEFLDGLPVTIRDGVLFRCCFGLEAGDFAELGTIDNLTILKVFLDEHPRHRGYRCAQLIGVLEIVLVPPKGNEELNQKIYEETGHEAFRDAAIRAPLNERHFELARQQFAELRRTSLSPEVLSLWLELYRG